MSCVALFTHDAFAEHDTGSHPERIDRYRRCRRAIEMSPDLRGAIHWVEAEPASDAAILACHTDAHLARIRSIDGRHGALDPDTVHSAGTYRAARLAAGAATGAALACWRGEHDAAFALVRPPGHHATPDRAMGFCFLNNAAIAARAVRSAGAERVLIVDWDVHHGNGTQDIFYDDGSVFYYSIHQSPHYPGTGHPEERGRGLGEGTTLNRPVPAGFPARRFVDRVVSDLDAIAAGFAPEFFIVSAGFDSHRDDPLGGQSLRESDFHALTRAVADRAGRGRVASVLEGGYDLDALSRSVSAHVAALAGVDAAPDA